MTILIIAAIILFIAFLKATVVISYSDEVAVYARVLFVKIKILPSKKKRGPHAMSPKKAERIRAKLRKKTEKKRLAAEEKEKEKAAKKAAKDKKSILDTISNIKLISGIAVTVIGRFFRHLRIKIARVRITVATGDAATTAIAYGAITQSINILLPALESVKNFKNLKNADIAVDLDYAAEEPTVDIKLAFSIRLWQVINMGFAALWKFVKHKLNNSEKKEEVSSSKNTEPAKNHKF